VKKQFCIIVSLVMLLATVTQASQEQLAKSIKDAKTETSQTDTQLNCTLAAVNVPTTQT